MLLKRFYDERLAQASYLIGCQATGEALVIDPSRDVEPYLRAAAEEGLTITSVTETHIHADYLSGSRELAARSSARLLLSAEGGEEWRYRFEHEPLTEGSQIPLGKLKIEVLHTPGHTPEHICFLLTDTPATSAPMGLFSGDCLFVGDVGRPDLLETAVGQSGAKEKGARTLYHTIQRLSALPDHLQIWPAHGAGSACGKGLGAVPSSTLGYEKLANWALKPQSEEKFVEKVLEGQPEPPRYFAQMKRMNRDGPPLLTERHVPSLLSPQRLDAVLSGWVVDTRPSNVYGARMVVKTINIPFNKGFTNWAGSLLPYDEDLYLITDRLEEAQHALSSIGLDRVAGYFTPESVEARAHDTQVRLQVAEAHTRKDRFKIVDVRSLREWKEGHIPGAIHIPLGVLAEQSEQLQNADRPILVHCQSGLRSAIAASLLRRLGFDRVMDMSGGFAAWKKAGYESEKGVHVLK